MTYGDYPDLEEVKKILIIKFRHLGDVLLTTPVLRLLKKRLPKAQIDMCIYKDCQPIIEGCEDINDILTYDKKLKKYNFLKKIKEEIKFLRNIRKRKYDLVINLTEGDRGAIIAKVSGAQYRVGYAIKKGLLGKKKFYTHLVKNCKNSRHTVEKNLDFIRKIGIHPIEKKDLNFVIPKKAYKNIEQILQDKNFDKFILIHPTSRWRFKCWPTFKMRNLTKKLIEKKYKIIFSAGKDEKEKQMIEDIIKGLPQKDIINLAGKISLKELGALIDKSELLLCVDSVSFHIASALKANCICLFGPTADKNWGNWNNKKAKIISKNFVCRPCNLDGCGGSKISDCLYAISEEEVFEEIFKKL